jgi:hypothetical protein
MATLSPVCTPSLADGGLEVGVGDGAGISGLALPVEGHPVAEAGVDVTVDTIDRHVEGASDEPLGEGTVPLQDLRPRRGPSQSGGLLGPEGQRVGRGVGVDARLGVGPGGQIGGRRKAPRLVQEGREALLLLVTHVPSFLCDAVILVAAGAARTLQR